MNDETKQLREQTFNQIILGLMLVGLGGAVVAVGLVGFSSPWFLRALALLIVTLVAFLLHRAGRYMIAAYVLVLEMIGIVVGMFLQPNTIYGIVPFLFIPIVIIAGFLLTPPAIVVISCLAVALALLVLWATGQLTTSVLLFLTLPLGLTFLTALLVVGNALYRVKLADLLLKNRDLLRNRTREMLDAQQKVEQLQERVTKLQQQLLQAESTPPSPAVGPTSDKFYQLIRGTIRELNHSARNLETTIDRIAEAAPVNGWAGLLEETWHTVDHLASLVVNLEELTELEKGEIQLNPRPVDVTTLIAELSSSARGLVRGKKIEIIEAAPEENPPLVADSDRIRQVMIYLIHNAIKYTDEGYIDIQAEVADQEVIFSVSDSGLGIPREEMEAVYETFGRSHDAAAQPRQGAGLGLAISKRLIELQGGQAWSVSTPGIGSTFYFSIPMTPASLEKVPALSEPVLSIDPDATVLSQPVDTVAVLPVVQLRAPEPVDREVVVGSNLPPVARFSSTYVTRFGLSLLGLLLLIGCVVAFLAFINQPTVDQTGSISTTAVSSAVASPAAEVVVVVSPTVRATATPSPATPTRLPATTVAPSPSATVTASATVTSAPPTASSTPPPTATAQRPTATLTLEPTSLIEVINTPTPVTPTPRPTATVAVTETAQPTPDNLPSRRLTFVVNGQLAGPDGSPNNLEIAANSGLSWSPAGELLFTSERDGNREIYLVEADGSGQNNLTQHPADDQQPAWSPDGRAVAFSSGRDGSFNIYVLTPASGAVTRLTNSRGFDEWPAWSPDGQQIAFVSTRDGGNQEIYVMDRDGGHQRRLTNDPAADTTPVWSPDGRHLLFVSEREGSADLYLVAASGGEAVPLTADLANELAPVWSPDGQTVAFVVETAESADIFTLPVPAAPFSVVPRRAWRQITDTPTRESYPVWGP